MGQDTHAQYLCPPWHGVGRGLLYALRLIARHGLLIAERARLVPCQAVRHLAAHELNTPITTRYAPERHAQTGPDPLHERRAEAPALIHINQINPRALRHLGPYSSDIPCYKLGLVGWHAA